jgi:hypothetical protein
VLEIRTVVQLERVWLVPQHQLALVIAAPFGLTSPFMTALVPVTEVADVVVTVGAPVTAIVKVSSVVIPVDSSVILTTKLYEPAVVGVPLNNPLLANVIPGGMVPEVTAQL